METDLAVIRRVSAARLSDRAVTETLGICRGLLADGHVDFGEAQLLADWLDRNPACSRSWPFNVLFVRLREMLADGVLDLDEQQELLDALLNITGGGFPGPGEVAPASTRLPLDDPPPLVQWPGRGFAFTGQMACGTRAQCAEAVVALGGNVLPGVSAKLDYLVIGSIGSEAWIQSTHGRKIEKAMALREQGNRLAIIGEEHWIAEVSKATGKR